MAFKIYTDSCCDLPEDLIKSYPDFEIVPLSFTIDDKPGENLSGKEFYDKLRMGCMSQTSQVTPSTFAESFEQYIQENNGDILYIGFSSALSGTVNSGKIAALGLSEKYPNNKIIVLDTLAASMGLGLIVHNAVQLRNRGKTIEETAQWVEQNMLKMNHWFTVNDLNFLQRGGRVSATTAWFGTILKIKPVLHVDNLGRLIPKEKVRGRKAAILRLFEKIENANLSGEPIFAISHGDCLEEAEILAELIQNKWSNAQIFISMVGSVIGSHSGPGTIALFFIGEQR